MHELGIVFHIIRSVEGVARQNNLRLHPVPVLKAV